MVSFIRRSLYPLPGERAPSTHWIGGCVEPQSGLDAVVKRKITSPYQDSNPPIIQPVAQRKPLNYPDSHESGQLSQ
jgi:hypothetical protein